MISLKENLKKIGLPKGTSFSYKTDFVSYPNSLRQAIRSMDAPKTSDWVENDNNKETKRAWTKECQGVAWDGNYWIFSNNSQKQLYVFNGGIDDENIIFQKNITEVLPSEFRWDQEGTNLELYYPDLEPGGLNHFGQLCFYNGYIYVSHYNDPNSHIFVFKDNNGVLEYERTITLEIPTSPIDGRTQKAEFQAINPWDGKAYTCFGDGFIDVLFIHYLNNESGKKAGELVRDEYGKNKTLNLEIPCLTVQGAAFSANGHIYIACDTRLGEAEDTRFIRCYSALNGHYFGDITVPAASSWHEQEGICYADLTFNDGHRAQIFSVLLNNIHESGFASPSIWFKHFCASNPDIV